MDTINKSRRSLLKGSLLATTLGISGIVELLTMGQAHAAWPKAAFDGESMADVMKELFNEESVPNVSDEVHLKAPDIAENGSVVPISVETSIPGVTRIVILVEENPSPMTASFDLSQNAAANVSTRIKMGSTSNVIAMVEAEGKIYAARKNVKVTIGGCGG